MKSVKKKIIVATFCSLGMFSLLGSPIFAKEDQPSRDIFVVLDDSGSMYYDYDSKKPIDTWSKAKYSMEVLASMLGTDDTMKIYYLSDYEDGKDGEARIEIDGSDNAQKNIEKIHSSKTESKDSPFEMVEEAYKDLEKSTADEKWLVVLSDGEVKKDDEFLGDQTTEVMDDFFESKDDDINVAFLGIGGKAIPITEDTSSNIYYEEAPDSDAILEKVSNISNRIFNTNKLNVSADTGEFTLDVPMSQLMVFVQGDGAKVENLVDNSNKEAGKMKPAVTVSASEKSDDKNHPDAIAASDLGGEIAVFEGDFAPGKYKVNTKNAKTIEVYYTPNVKVVASLTTESGEEIKNFSDLPTGDYKLHFDLVSGLDESPLPQNNVIAQSQDGIQYEAIIRNNGKTLDAVYEDGDNIHVEQGALDIDVTAKFLKYNTVETELNFSIFSEKNVTFTAEEPTVWKLGKTLSTEEPLRLSMEAEGKVPTAEEWSVVQVPEVSFLKTTDKGVLWIENPVVEKSAEPGVFLVTPNESQTSFVHQPYGEMQMQVSMNESVNGIDWKGESELPVKIEDNRSWFVKNGDWLAHNWFWFLIPLAIIIWLIGYLPVFKKRFPKMPKQSTITVKPKNGRRETAEPTVFAVDPKSKWLPYVNETARFNIVPKVNDDSMMSKMAVEAGENGRMIVTNASKFADRGVYINGEEIKKENLASSAGAKKNKNKKDAKNGSKNGKKKPLSFTRNAVIETRGDRNTYFCKLSEKFTRS